MEITLTNMRDKDGRSVTLVNCTTSRYLGTCEQDTESLRTGSKNMLIS